MEDDDIQDKISILKDLNTELDDFDSLISVLTDSKDKLLEYEELMTSLDPMDRINLNWNFSYSIYTLYYSN
jgi:hypothetical protein